MNSPDLHAQAKRARRGFRSHQKAHEPHPDPIHAARGSLLPIFSCTSAPHGPHGWESGWANRMTTTLTTTHANRTAQRRTKQDSVGSATTPSRHKRTPFLRTHNREVGSSSLPPATRFLNLDSTIIEGVPWHECGRERALQRLPSLDAEQATAENNGDGIGRECGEPHQV